MATKKTTALAKASEQGGGLVVASWMKEMAGKARDVASVFRTGVPRIIHRQAQIMIDNQPVKDNKLPVVIIGYCFEKAYYTKGFNPNEKAAPDCYAFHAPDKPFADAQVEMTPNPACKAKQSDNCAGCKWNRFGTAKNQDGSPGKGKRCGDKVRLLCISATGSKDSLLKSQVRIFSVPGNSLSNWGAYVGSLADQGILPEMVITQLGTEVVPPPGQGYKITFLPVGSLDEEQYKQVLSMGERALQTLTMPYPTLSAGEDTEEVEETPAEKAKAAKRKARVS